MLSYKSTTSGRKGLSRARLFIMKESFFCGAFHEEFLSNAREPVTGYRSSPCQWKGRSQLHQCSQSWGCCTYWGTLGKRRSGWCLGEVAVRRKGRAELGPCRAARCLSEVTATESVLDNATADNGAKQKTIGTTIINYFCFIKAGFCGYEWNLPCAQWFRLAGKKKIQVLYIFRSWIGNFLLLYFLPPP